MRSACRQRVFDKLTALSNGHANFEQQLREEAENELQKAASTAALPGNAGPADSFNDQAEQSLRPEQAEMLQPSPEIMVLPPRDSVQEYVKHLLNHIQRTIVCSMSKACFNPGKTVPPCFFFLEA